MRPSPAPRTASRVWLSLAIGLEVGATMSLKAAALGVPWLYAVVVGGYLGSFSCLALALRGGMGLGVAYGIWGACGVILTAVLSFAIYSEPITPLMAVGILAIAGGVLCVELGAQSARRRRETN